MNKVFTKFKSQNKMLVQINKQVCNKNNTFALKFIGTRNYVLNVYFKNLFHLAADQN